MLEFKDAIQLAVTALNHKANKLVNDSSDDPRFTSVQRLELLEESKKYREAENYLHGILGRL